jgi:membrane protein DedA with SNARE-associated domain
MQAIQVLGINYRQMWQELAKAIPVFLSSAFKFILGPLEGYALRLYPITTCIATIAGMMLSVVAFTFFGEWIRKRILQTRFASSQKSISSGKFSGVIKKYGLGGVAFLTPLFLTPIGGTLLAVSLGKPRNKILLFMFVSAVCWAVVFTAAIYAFGKVITNWVP